MSGPVMLILLTANIVLFGALYFDWRIHKMAVDLTAEFANLDAAIAALPARVAAAVAAGSANAIQPADVAAAADQRAAQVNAILPTT